MTKSKKKHTSKNTLSLLLIALPGIAYLIINNYIPIMGIFIAFKKFSYAKGIWGSPWCGFDNFKFLFLTDDAWVITRNTLLYNLAFIVIGTVISVIFAILLQELGEMLRGKFFQSVFLYHSAASETDHRYHDIDGNRSRILFRFRSVLSGADECRNLILCHTDDRYLCISWSDGTGECGNVFRGRCIPVTGRFCTGNDRKLYRTEKRSGKCIVLGGGI